MKLREKTLLCAAAALALCTAASALTSDSSANPYQGIVERNVFGLKPPPPPPDPEANKPPPPKLTLTGILSGSVFGGKRALMKAPPSAGKPGEQAKGEQSYILAVGQRDGDVEVLDIDDKAGSVRVNNAGITVVLTFEKDGQKGSVGAPPPGVIPTAPGAIPPPIVPAANPYKAAGGSPGFVPPSRPMRYPGSAGSMTPPVIGGASPVASYAGASAPSVSVGGSTLSLGSSSSPNIPAPVANPVHELSFEEQMLMVEMERERTKNLVLSGKMPPLPPTPATPVGSPGYVPPFVMPGTGSQGAVTPRGF
jgi:hypothetical protein